MDTLCRKNTNLSSTHTFGIHKLNFKNLILISNKNRRAKLDMNNLNYSFHKVINIKGNYTELKQQESYIKPNTYKEEKNRVTDEESQLLLFFLSGFELPQF